MQFDKPCPCCESTQLEFIGTKSSILRSIQFIEYRYWYCKNCFYRFQGNPDTNFEELYNEDYYRGKGADKLVDYEFELNFPDLTVRNFEFAGILEVVESLRDHTTKQKSGRSVNWLDFGCGNGAFEGKKSGINILEFENLQEQSFEVITAIEVLEHTHDPRATIQLIYKLLKPGGLFFYTTGNSRPFSNNFLGWRYTSASDVHIGFFEPLTMNKLLEELGFSVQQSENYSGWGNIYKYKVLKNLKIKKRGLGLFVPNFSLIVKALDRKFQLMAMPAGVRPKNK